MKFEVGEIVKARGREWIVQPESTDEVLRVAPITGEAEEATGILMQIEGNQVQASTYPVPDLKHIGDHTNARTLRLAASITNRNTVGPFLSFGKIAVQPRPYQLVPLLLALRKDPVRILIADDVGIGKTVESLIIVRELLDRGEIQRFCVLCPPHLAPQWQAELRDKFHIDAEVLMGKTAKRLEDRAGHRSVFEAFPFLVVSLDYIKVEKRRQELLRSAPEMIVVDEAHTCTKEGSKDNQLRYKTVKDLSHAEIGRTEDGVKITRHLILVTATPHTGKDARFKSLIGLLDQSLESLPENLAGDHNRGNRNKLAQFVVQRRRQDIKKYVDDAETPFPERHEADINYSVASSQFNLLKQVDEYYEKRLKEKTGRRHEQLTYLSYHTVLKAFSSSPRAAYETLQNRMPTTGVTEENIDEVNDINIGDQEDTTPDATMGSSLDEEMHREFTKWSKTLESMPPGKDAKLQALIGAIKDLHKERRQVIVFCHYIKTAEYLQDELQKAFATHAVGCVTGRIDNEKRPQVIKALLEEKRPPLLVATDCLSEGVNLQEDFDSVVHYDLSWNPTRHEQREGRVDRFNQKKKVVKAISIYADNNGIDAAILKVILRKQRSIRNETGVIVPAPKDLSRLRYQILKPGFLSKGTQTLLGEFSDSSETAESLQRIDLDWRNASERESKQRTLFAQGTIKEDEVKAEYEAIQAATANEKEVEEFVTNAIRLHGGTIQANKGVFEIDCTPMDDGLRIRLPLSLQGKFKATFTITDKEGVVYLARTHPFTEAVADYVLLSSMDPFDLDSSKRRLGVTYTDTVDERTRVLLVRHRYLMKQLRGERILEEIRFHAYRKGPTWLGESETLDLVKAHASQSTSIQQAKGFLEKELQSLPVNELKPWQDQRCASLEESHEEIRGKAKQLGGQITITPHGTPDVIGVYVFLPGGEA